MKFRTLPPNKQRKVFALCVFFAIGLLATLIRVSRPDFGFFTIVNPLDFGGTSPNFFVCFACPLASAFLLGDTIDFSYYAKLVYGTAIGLVIYEFFQIYIQSRTFDWGDIIAYVAGATVSLLVVTIVFLIDYKAIRKNID